MNETKSMADLRTALADRIFAYKSSRDMSPPELLRLWREIFLSIESKTAAEILERSRRIADISRDPQVICLQHRRNGDRSPETELRLRNRITQEYCLGGAVANGASESEIQSLLAQLETSEKRKGA